MKSLLFVALLSIFSSVSFGQDYKSSFSIGEASESILLKQKTVPFGYMWKVTSMDESTDITLTMKSSTISISGSGEDGITIVVDHAITLYFDLPLWIPQNYTVYFTCLSGRYVKVEVYS